VKAGRGYIIRFFDERRGESFYYKEPIGISNKRVLTASFKESTIYTDYKSAEEKIVAIKKNIKKTYGKGYLYISKTFYKEIELRVYPPHKTGNVPTRLTKPDRNDFLKAL